METNETQKPKLTKSEAARLNGKKGGRPRKSSVSQPAKNPPRTAALISAARENGKKGGRPKGSKSAATIEREAVLRAYRERVCRQADRLLDAELTVALGCSVLCRKPKTGKERKVEIVKDEETIRAFLDGELEGDAVDDWYFITTEKPDTLTVRNMLDRTFDRPMQRTELSGQGGGPVVTRVIHEEYEEASGSGR